MRKRNAFVESYKKTGPFSEKVVTDLIAEYEAAEDANYLNPDAGTEAAGAGGDDREPAR
jgi:tubulin gamma